MFRDQSISRYGLIVGAAALALTAYSLPASGASKSKPGGTSTSTTTGQAVNVEIKAASSFQVIDNETYAFNNEVANTYFETTVAGPTSSCSGGGRDGANCLPDNQPSVPTQPAADPRQNPGDFNKCIFSSGGPLLPLPDYPQSVSVSGKNGKGTWTYTWTYSVKPKATDPVEPLTAWDLVHWDGQGLAHVVVNGSIAAQSSMTSSQFPSVNGAPGKISFSLDPTRIQNLAVTVYLITSDGKTAVETKYPTFSIVQGVDFSFLSSNGGTNGTNPILYGPSAFNDALMKDSTTSNNTFSNLYYAALDAVGFDLLPGDYAFTLTGSVKDVSTNTAGNFSIEHIVHINTQGCSKP